VITTQIEEVDPDRFLPVGRSMAFRREWWERVGGFPEWVGNCEDLMFDLRVREAGGRFGFAPDAICIWYPSRSLRKFFAKYLSYARGDGRAGLWTRRHLLRYAAYATGAATLALAWREPIAWALLTLGFLAYAWKFHRRLSRIPPGEGAWSAIASRALLPVILVAGDVAKMIGYPVGLLSRRRAKRQAALLRARRAVRSQ
jgi:GT2 family glycosyltransferase